jgi:hypothetical protein
MDTIAITKARESLAERVLDMATAPGFSFVSTDAAEVFLATGVLPHTIATVRQVRDACAAAWQDAGGRPSDENGYHSFLQAVLP